MLLKKMQSWYIRSCDQVINGFSGVGKEKKNVDLIERHWFREPRDTMDELLNTDLMLEDNIDFN